MRLDSEVGEVIDRDSLWLAPGSAFRTLCPRMRFPPIGILISTRLKASELRAKGASCKVGECFLIFRL